MIYKKVYGALTIQPESYSDCFELIRSDFYRYLGKRIDSRYKLWLYHFKQSGMGFLYFYRLCQYKSFLWPYFRLRMEKYSRKYGLQLSLKASTGAGLYLGHGISIVINSTAVIGSNVNLSQFTTIGANKGKAAVIEDDVYIGPSVCTVENVRIGTCAMVGAGAVVTKDVPAHTSVAGVPAKVIKSENQYTPINKWSIK